MLCSSLLCIAFSPTAIDEESRSGTRKLYFMESLLPSFLFLKSLYFVLIELWFLCRSIPPGFSLTIYTSSLHRRSPQTETAVLSSALLSHLLCPTQLQCMCLGLGRAICIAYCLITPPRPSICRDPLSTCLFPLFCASMPF
ncbi:hypothetical protein MRB53_002610 [Persea americana]|uniref:Uncharacterized protein n=1 Tax=Persea americana TaxID=3435 RepID=A0ACC2MUV5_PERAE|nr:hypothetical protein MRB53_002610 [Persea americana]